MPGIPGFRNPGINSLTECRPERWCRQYKIDVTEISFVQRVVADQTQVGLAKVMSNFGIYVNTSQSQIPFF